jgi:hypothetical protein
VDVELRDVEHLHMVMTALEADNDVAELARLRRSGPEAAPAEAGGAAPAGAGKGVGPVATASVMPG